MQFPQGSLGRPGGSEGLEFQKALENNENAENTRKHVETLENLEILEDRKSAKIAQKSAVILFWGKSTF